MIRLKWIPGRRLLPLLLLLTAVSLGAEPSHWVAQSAGTQSNGFDVAVDGDGNSYVTGSFKGEISFAQAAMASRAGRRASTDVFVVSYAPDGRVRWARQEGGGGDDAGLHIAAGRTGVYVTGFYQGAAEFGGHRLPASPGRCLFVAKYDFDGNLTWARAAGDAGVMGPEGIALDAEDNCYVVGYFKQYADFGQARLEKAMAKNLFLVRYDANGDFSWARAITGGASFTTGPWARGMAAAPDGTILVTGKTSGENRFGARRLVTGVTRFGSQSLPNEEIFVARYSVEGEVLAVKSVASFAAVEEIACDGEGNVFLAGAFKGAASGRDAGTARFGEQDVAATPNDGDRHDNGDIFLAKYDRELNPAWVRGAGGPGDDAAYGLAVDRGGNASITGLFCGTARFGERILTVNGGSALKGDMFLATYAADGTLIGLEQGGGEGLDRGDGVAAGRDGSRYVTGFFNGPAPRFGDGLLEPGPGSLLFVARYPAIRRPASLDAAGRPMPAEAEGVLPGAQRPGSGGTNRPAAARPSAIGEDKEPMHADVPPMTGEEPQKEGFYPLCYLIPQVEITFSASLGASGQTRFMTIAIPLSTYPRVPYFYGDTSSIPEDVLNSDRFEYQLGPYHCLDYPVDHNIAALNRLISGSDESPIPTTGEALRAAAGHRAITAWIVQNHMDRIIDGAFRALKDDFGDVAGAAEPLDSLFSLARGPVGSLLCLAERRAGAESRRASIWSVIPWALYYTMRTHNRVYARGLDDHLIPLAFSFEFNEPAVGNWICQGGAMSFAIDIPAEYGPRVTQNSGGCYYDFVIDPEGVILGTPATSQEFWLLHRMAVADGRNEFRVTIRMHNDPMAGLPFKSIGRPYSVR